MGVSVTVPITGGLLITLTDTESFTFAPSASVAITSQLILSPGELIVGVRVRLVPQPSVTPDEFVHFTVNEGVSPSASLADTLQVRMVVVVTPVAGLMVRVSMVGSVFSISTESVSLSVPPYPSVAVTVQTIKSPGCTEAGSKVMVEVEESTALVPWTVHA